MKEARKKENWADLIPESLVSLAIAGNESEVSREQDMQPWNPS